MRRFLLAVGLLLVGLATISAVSQAEPAGELSDTEFERIQHLLRPDQQEAWRTIPWRTSLLDAQRTAVAEQKPIFIWAMDGHPLGCT